jgi:TRAP-type C4-dicarboxylate transport system permease small subunit
MDTVLLSLRWQNILAIWIMAILLAFVAIFATQGVRRVMTKSSTKTTDALDFVTGGVRQ